MNERLKRGLAKLDTSCAQVAAYVAAREAGFSVVQRRIVMQDDVASSTLVLQNGPVRRTVSGSSAALHHCAFSHFYTSHDLLLADETSDKPLAPDQEPAPPGKISVELRIGLLRATSKQIKFFELEEIPRNHRNRYRVWLPLALAKSLKCLPSEPQLKIDLRMGEQRASAFIGYVDRLVPFEFQNEQLVELEGGHALYESRVLVAAKFNFQVDPWPGIGLLAAWLDTNGIQGVALNKRPELPELNSFLQPTSMKGVREFAEFLAATRERHKGENIEVLCNWFERALAESPRQYSALTPHAFLNSAIVAENGEPIYVVIGSVRGVSLQGMIQIAPNIALAAPDQIPFRLVGESGRKPLCEYWDKDAARLITFCRASGAPDTPHQGWTALSQAFDFLNVAAADASWLNSDVDGNEVPIAVDGRTQDSVLELDRWYHVHDLLTGTAHQYHGAKQYSTNELSSATASMLAISKRIQAFQGIPGISFQQLKNHLLKAIQWVSRSRGSTTPSEQFLCAWIALEFLALRSGQSADDSAIKAGVVSRIATLLSQGDRDQRRYWTRQMESAYDLRCELVHEARDDEGKLNRLIPVVTQAAIAIIMFCALSLQNITEDQTPADMLDTLVRNATS